MHSKILNKIKHTNTFVFRHAQLRAVNLKASGGEVMLSTVGNFHNINHQ